jgi:hypothetical protein
MCIRGKGSSAQVLEVYELGDIIGDRCHFIAKLIAPQVEVAQLWEILVDIVVLDQLSHEPTIREVPAEHQYLSILAQSDTKTLLQWCQDSSSLHMYFPQGASRQSCSRMEKGREENVLEWK